MTRSPGRRAKPRGTIDALPSGTLRVRVYAGVDPLTGKRHDLVELAASPAEPERVRTRLLAGDDYRARRGEPCGLGRSHVELEEAVLRVATSGHGPRAAMKLNTQTHQQRRTLR